MKARQKSLEAVTRLLETDIFDHVKNINIKIYGNDAARIVLKLDEKRTKEFLVDGVESEIRDVYEWIMDWLETEKQRKAA